MLEPTLYILAAMYLAGISQVFYAYSNEDGLAYDEALSAEKSYRELSRPIDKREMPLRYLPVRHEGEDLYGAWQKQGQKNSN